MLEVRNLALRYPSGKLALSDFSIAARAGELVIVLGGNGSGKTTLLRCISRTLLPSAGEVWVNGVALTRLGGERLRRARLQLALISQHAALVRRRSVLANVATGALGRHNGLWTALGGFPRAELDAALRCLDEVGLAPLAAQRASALAVPRPGRLARARPRGVTRRRRARPRPGGRQGGRRFRPPRPHLARLAAEHEHDDAHGARRASPTGRGALRPPARRSRVLALPPALRPDDGRVVLPGAVGRERLPHAVARRLGVLAEPTRQDAEQGDRRPRIVLERLEDRFVGHLEGPHRLERHDVGHPASLR